MGDRIMPAMLGVFVMLLGISNMKGHIGSIHWYHRKRVSEEDRPAFGRLVGLGTLIIGAALVLFSLLNLAAEWTQNDVFVVVGSGIMAAAAVAGLGMSLWAMIRYNKGIF